MSEFRHGDAALGGARRRATRWAACVALAAAGLTVTASAQSRSLVKAAATASCSPAVRSVSTFAAAQGQDVKVTGSCFGNGNTSSSTDTAYFEIEDNTASPTWRACWSADPMGANTVTCTISSWTNQSITFAGFTGEYGEQNFTVNDGDSITISVWNAQTDAGPGSCTVVAGTPGPTTCSTTSTPIVGENKEEEEECEPASTPVDSLTTPSPPTDRATTLGRIAEAFVPKGIEPEYCSYRAKYTKAEKEAAHEWAIWYGLQSAYENKVAAGLGGLAVGSAAIPDPTVSKVATVVYGLEAGTAAWLSAEFGEKATLMSSIEHDPPDREWRSIASRPVLHKSRLPKLGGLSLSHTQQVAIRAYLFADAETVADDTCETESINRAMTALANKDKAIAAAQYKAGARCATTNVAIAKRLPRLSAAVKPVFSMLVERLSSASVEQFFVKHLKADERSEAFRKRAEAKTIALLTSVIALPKTALTRLEKGLQARVTTSASTLKKTLQVRLPSVREIRAWRTLQEQTAQVLAAAAAR